MQTDAVAKTRADALPEGITATCRPEFELGGMVTSNNEAERREVAPLQTKLIYPNHRFPPWLT